MPVPRVKNRPSGPSGVANVRLFKNFARVTFQEDGRQFDIPKDNVPDYLRKSGTYWCMLSSDTARLVTVKINSGKHIGGFIGIKRGEDAGLDDPPYPEEKTISWVDDKNKKRSRTYEFFVVRHLILHGDYEGMIVNGELEYRFVEVENDDGESIAGIFGRGSAANLLEDYIEAAGIDVEVENIPWSENVCPWLEEELLQRARPYQFGYNEKGYIDSYSFIMDEVMGDYRKLLRKAHREMAKRAEERRAGN